VSQPTLSHHLKKLRDGTPWEVFATHEDTEEAGDGGLAVAEAGSCGCGQTAGGSRSDDEPAAVA